MSKRAALQNKLIELGILYRWGSDPTTEEKLLKTE